MLLKPGDLVYVRKIEKKINTKIKYDSLYCFEFNRHFGVIIGEILKQYDHKVTLNFCSLCITNRDKNILIENKICTVIDKKEIKQEDLSFFKDERNKNLYLIDNYLKNWCYVLYDNNKAVWLPYINVRKI
jgi:hypothetical protein